MTGIRWVAIEGFCACVALVACSGALAPFSTPGAGVPPSGFVVPKAPLRGLIDMQDIAWHDVNNGQPEFTIANARKFPGTLGGIVINATWSQMQPKKSGAVDFTAVDAALKKIDAYNTSNPTSPLGVKLRIYGGSNAPRWAKLIGNGPITIYRNPAGCDGKTDTCKLTVGPFWTKPYIEAWRAFQATVAERYDSEHSIVAVAVTSCAAQTDEPFVASSGPMSKANLAAAGYTDATEQACLRGATDDYRDWANTDVDFPFNAYSETSGGQDPTFTIRVMRICRKDAGARCVLDNHALQTPLTSDLAIYDAIARIGGLVNFQTQSPQGMGCIWPETVTQGVLLGARAIEICSGAQYQGFDTLRRRQMKRLRALFYNLIATPTPIPSPLPTPCKGFNS